MRDDIRVVFTDVDMPGRLNGFQLAQHIQDHHHRVRVIIGSGKCRPAPDDIAPGMTFLQKPYAGGSPGPGLGYAAVFVFILLIAGWRGLGGQTLKLSSRGNGPVGSDMSCAKAARPVTI
jgi:hypothetical protein